jgi:hypothetical protein
MSRWLKLAGLWVILVSLVFGIVSTVTAGDGNSLQGLVFMDNNGDGKWQPCEPGYPGIWSEYFDEDDVFIRRYVGATVSMSADGGVTVFSLESAGPREPNKGEVDLCSYQDYTIPDGNDDDCDRDINPNPLRPCAGTWGLHPAGEKDMVWMVWVTPPEGYVVTSPNPQYYWVGSGKPPLDFGIAPASP